MNKKAIRQRLRGVKERADSKNISFDLDEEWFIKRCEDGVCEMTGVKFKVPNSMYSPYSASVDRVDSNKGYTKDNCKLILFGLNTAKSSSSYEALYEWAAQFVNKYREDNDL